LKSQTQETIDSDGADNTTLTKLKLAAENWDIPIIVTTNVQFFESLYSNRSSRSRKLHNIAKSVIIFDETQMLPRDYIRPCLYSVSELVKNYGVSAIFCTATQPSIEKFLPGNPKIQELAPDPQASFDFFKRVRVRNAGKISDDELVQNINVQPQALCIINTRKHARGLFEGLINEGRFHLSTFMCAAHRRETILAIRGRLRDGKPCRVVSTQIMEAGIDLDFPIGYRALSGLDSIIQAAGRVNREGKNTSGELIVFEPDSQFVKRTPPYIKQNAEVARNILRRYEDPVCLQAITEYYTLLYDLQDPKAFDRKEILDCFEKPGANDAVFDFQTASQRFKMIEENTVAVVIKYNQEVVNILEKVRYSKFPLIYSREIQPYTVNIYEQEYQSLLSSGLIDIYSEVYAVLNDMAYYHDETGLILPDGHGGETIFF
jgi:CRISPR-associated endonuclease/helicase Cas3